MSELPAHQTTPLQEVGRVWQGAGGITVRKCLSKFSYAGALFLCDWPVGHEGKHAAWGQCDHTDWYITWLKKG